MFNTTQVVGIGLGAAFTLGPKNYVERALSYLSGHVITTGHLTTCARIIGAVAAVVIAAISRNSHGSSADLDVSGRKQASSPEKPTIDVSLTAKGWENDFHDTLVAALNVEIEKIGNEELIKDFAVTFIDRLNESPRLHFKFERPLFDHMAHLQSRVYKTTKNAVVQHKFFWIKCFRKDHANIPPKAFDAFEEAVDRIFSQKPAGQDRTVFELVVDHIPECD